MTAYTKPLILPALLTLACAGLFPWSAEAYNFETYLGNPIKYQSASITYRPGPGSFPPGERRTAIERAFTRWNEGPGAFVFNTPYYGDKNQARANGQNEIWFTSNKLVLGNDLPPATCLKLFAYTPTNPRIIEADIVFNSKVPWSFSDVAAEMWNYGGGSRPFVSLLLHESGHSFGLKHNSYSYNIMGEDWTHVHVNGGIHRPYGGEDAMAGQVRLYGLDNPRRNDLSVAHWKYSKADGEYSEHTETALYSGNVLVAKQKNADASVTLIGGRPVYQVGRLSTYNVEFTYENNGANGFKGVNVGFYISTDKTITTLDKFIGSATFNLNPGDPATRRASVTIPDSLTVGQYYWLGVVVDKDNKIAEYAEDNNASWHIIRVVK